MSLTYADLRTEIEAAWEARDQVSTDTTGPVRTAVDETLRQLDSGDLRVATRGEDGAWTTHQWVKQAILLSFRLNPNRVHHAPGPGPYWDKVTPSSRDGRPPASKPPVSAPCPAAWSARVPSSPATWC
jgi:2,3,4,5-tetrahydropyridine-2-carboxylate N-succinyltransferase